jgi:hypothetical protein
VNALPRGLRLALLLVLFCFPAAAQDAALPTVTFSFDFPGSDPEHFVLSVRSDGHSTYDSDGKLTPQSDSGDPFHFDFTISQSSRDHIFDLAKRAHYFEGEVDSKPPNIAFMGKKTLSYKDAQRNTQAIYNYTAIPEVQELTAFCQHLSETLEFGRRLAFYRRYQKLALDDELKRMEEMVQSNELSELPAIVPILQGIAKDPSVLNMVRARSLRILYKAGVSNSMH